MKLHGPAYQSRHLCVNKADFFTLDEVIDIPFSSFISIVDEDQFIYGFEICSLYYLLYNTNEDEHTLNPYNRKPLASAEIKKQIIQLYKIGKILNIHINLNVNYDKNKPILSPRERAITLFEKINTYDIDASCQWFLDLPKEKLTIYFKKLQENWQYRLNLTKAIRKNICPPDGNPFQFISASMIFEIEDCLFIQNALLDVLERWVYLGINDEMKCLGSFHVIGALTLVSKDARNAFPFFYQSFK